MERRDPWLYCLWSLSPKSDRGKRHNFVNWKLSIRMPTMVTLGRLIHVPYIRFGMQSNTFLIRNQGQDIVNMYTVCSLQNWSKFQLPKLYIHVRMFRIIKRDFRENLFVLCVDCQLFFIKTTLWQSLRDHAVTAIFITTEY